MRGRVALIIGGVLLLLAAIGGPLYIAINEDQVPEQAQAPLDAASTASEHFLDNYLEPNGRVVRRDQGGDTVSEGQAYAMLVAVAIGDQARFDSAWNWSKENLRQPSGLFAWNWKDGKIIDPQPASDADLDMARALTVAGRQFNQPSYGEEAKTLATAILRDMTLDTDKGSPVLLAGPWATEAPYYVNPSYDSPRSFDELALLTGDNRWNQLASGEQQRMGALVVSPSGEVSLPPDWARVGSDGTIMDAANPAGDVSVRYSYDALRTPIRLAESCDATDRDQAVKIWSILNRSPDTRTSAVMNIDGSVINDDPTAVGAVAAAGGAKAAGDTNQVLTLLTQADQLDEQTPTYYGSAWAALGRIMLTTNWLGACA